MHVAIKGFARAINSNSCRKDGKQDPSNLITKCVKNDEKFLGNF